MWFLSDALSERNATARNSAHPHRQSRNSFQMRRKMVLRIDQSIFLNSIRSGFYFVRFALMKTVAPFSSRSFL